MQNRHLLLLATLAAITATSALSQAPAPVPTIPDFSGTWTHGSLPGLEPLASGPTSLTNRSRRNGVSDYNALVGDYTNPILRPHAADIVKKFGEQSLAGVTYGNPANQCWPEPIPFIYKNTTMQMLQGPDHITFLYNEGPDVRRVRMNKPHPARVTPSFYGDSVAYYEGDTLVIDTVGQKTNRPFAMLDLYGTPFTEKLHVVERYRLIPYDEAKDGLERDAKENQLILGLSDPNYRGKFLQIAFTVEDEGVFTTPWSATITYRPGLGGWVESICAENTNEYYYNKQSEVPTAPKPDF